MIEINITVLGKIDWKWEVEFHKSFRQAEPGDNYGILTIEEE